MLLSLHPYTVVVKDVGAAMRTGEVFLAQGRWDEAANQFGVLFRALQAGMEKQGGEAARKVRRSKLASG